MKRTTRMLAALALLLGSMGQAKAGYTVESFNANKTPYNSTWGSSDVGWFYTPSVSYSLNSVLTKFGYADGRTVTEAIYDTAPPDDGGTLLRTATFTPISNSFAGGSFSALNVVAGHTYFVGFVNVGALGVNFASPGTPVSTFRYSNDYPSVNFSHSATGIGANNAILEFQSSSPLSVVSAPSSLTLCTTVLVAVLGYFGYRRRKLPVG